MKKQEKKATVNFLQENSSSIKIFWFIHSRNKSSDHHHQYRQATTVSMFDYGMGGTKKKEFFLLVCSIYAKIIWKSKN